MNSACISVKKPRLGQFARLGGLPAITEVPSANSWPPTHSPQSCFPGAGLLHRARHTQRSGSPADGSGFNAASYLRRDSLLYPTEQP